MIVEIKYIKDTYILDLDEYAKIHWLKLLLRKKTNIPSYDQELFYKGIRLDNDKQLIDYGILNNSVIHLFI